MNMEKSQLLFEKSRNIIPGGVNSPVRAFISVGMTPPFIKSAKGSRVVDADGNEYIDYVGSWGPMILGHAHCEVVDEIKKACEDGTSYGAPTEKELTLSEIIIDAVPSVEMVRMVSSGTEAVMSAVRVARGFTGRDKVLKFEGCYHGHSDGLLAKAGSGLLTTGVPDSGGVPEDYVKNTIVAPYNDCDQLENIFKRYANDLAAVIVEPVAGNMGVVQPKEGFLELIRKLTLKHGVILIFDEVITGFRVSFKGAQGYFGIEPDMTVFGKIIGGGMPVGAYGGRKDIMSVISPIGPVYQAGTLSGNPIAMAAGIKTLEILRDNPHIYKEIEDKAIELEKAFLDSSKKYGIALKVNRIGSLLSAFFTGEDVTDLKTAMKCDLERFPKYFRNMLQSGIYMAPSQFEAIFVSSVHGKEDIDKTISAVDYAFSNL